MPTFKEFLLFVSKTWKTCDMPFIPKGMIWFNFRPEYLTNMGTFKLWILAFNWIPTIIYTATKDSSKVYTSAGRVDVLELLFWFAFCCCFLSYWKNHVLWLQSYLSTAMMYLSFCISFIFIYPPTVYICLESSEFTGSQLEHWSRKILPLLSCGSTALCSV